jgi:hypothetical protein
LDKVFIKNKEFSIEKRQKYCRWNGKEAKEQPNIRKEEV